MADARRFLTPVGRLVQGDCFEPQLTDAEGKPRVVKEGPNAGQPNPQYYIGVAFSKHDTGFNELYGIMDAAAREAFPHLFPNGGNCVNPQFSFKVIDGDGVDTNGKANGAKEGFAGNWVVRFTTAFAPKVYYHGKYSDAERITKERAFEVKRGYFVRVAGSTKGNGSTQRPGIHMNVDMVEVMAHGAEISSGPDAATTFTQAPAPAALPAGAIALPSGIGSGYVAPSAVPHAAPAPAPAPAPHPMPAGVAAVAPAPAPSPASAPGAQPYTGYMAPPAPAAAPAPAPAPAPASPWAGLQLTAAAAGQTFESLAQAGWTVDLMLGQGMAVRV